MKKKLLTFTIGTGLVMGLAACSGGGSSDTSENVSTANPQTVFLQSCASCHGEQLQGGFGPNLKKVGSKYTEKQIADIIKNGKNNGKMPGSLVSPADADKVAAWLAAKK